jgi:DNA-binding transcriptional ArsR family regulator
MSIKRALVFEKLKEAYVRGLKGTVESFDIWLKTRQVDPRRFNHKSITKFLLDNPNETVNRERELASLAEFVGFYRREKQGLYFLPVVGVPGVGKSQILQTLMGFLSKVDKELTTYSVDASIFARVDETEEESQSYLRILEELKTKKYDVLLIDSCEHDKNIVESLRGIFRQFSRGVVVSAWTPYHWSLYREAIEELTPVSKEVLLQPLDKESTLLLVSRVLDFVSIGSHKWKETVSSRIYDFSSGIPSVTIALLVRSFIEAFQSRKPDVDGESVTAAAKFLGLYGLNEKLAKLAEHQILVLKHILLEPDSRGIRPSTLVELLGKDKATISYHLNVLSAEKILTNERIGRWVFYRVREEIEPLVALRVAKEDEYLG